MHATSVDQRRNGRRTRSLRNAVASTLESLESRRMLSVSPAKLLATTPAKDIILSTPAATYTAPSKFIYKTGGTLSKAARGEALTIGTDYVKANAAAFGLTAADIENSRVSSYYTDADTGISHIYLKQTFNGLDITNADMAITVLKDGRVLSAGGNFVAGVGALKANKITAPISAIDGLTAAANKLNLNLAHAPTITTAAVGVGQVATFRAADISDVEIPGQLHFVATADGIKLAWNYVIDVKGGEHWYDAHVSADDGSLLWTSDWVDNYVDPSIKLPTGDGNAAVATTPVAGSVQGHVTQTTDYNAAYNVYALPNQSPSTGTRTIQTNPWDPTAAPFGWQDTNGTSGGDSNTTVGNFTSAQEDRDANNTGGIVANGGALVGGAGSLNFDFPIDFTIEPTTANNQLAAITNLYYWNNMLHDLHYKYGFTEVAGNFQQLNYSGQGLGNDRVQADAQDASSTNNANFNTPPDGQSGRMQMFLFTAPTPDRDGDLDAQVMIHEFGHGVSNRLTGGPANSNALNNVQSGGMGEGWGDWFGLMFLQTDGSVAAQNASVSEGTYVLNQPLTGAGIRRQPYSYNMAINNQTLGTYNTSSEVHNAGELWATVLWDMNWNLIRKHGFSSNVMAGYGAGDTPAGKGNLLALRLVEDAMKIQPANPSFLQARDAIIAADQALNGGADLKEIWRAFARRGWGVNATTASSSSTSVVQNFDVPPALFDPFVTASSPAGAVNAPSVSTAAFTFDEPMDPASFSLADVTSFTGPGGSNLLATISGTAWSNANKTLTVTFAAQSTQGPYTMTIGPNITAADDGHAMDQNQDGTLAGAGDSFTATFTLDNTPGPDAAGYEATAAPLRNIDLVVGGAGVTTLVNASDDGAGTIALPAGNSFTFYGTTYTSISANANGLITFGTTSTAFSNTDLSSSPTQAAIAASWDDWTTNANGTGGTDSAVLWSISGNELIVEWSDVPGRTGASTGTTSGATFQAILSLNTTGGRNGDIVFNYKDLDAGNATWNEAAGATEGIKTAGTAGLNRLLIAQNRSDLGAYVATGKALRFSVTRANGVVFGDDNGNGTQDAGETAVPNALVYADANNNGTRDVNETSTFADGTGAFSLGTLLEGANTLRVDSSTLIDTLVNPSTTLLMGEVGTGRNIGVFNTLITGTSGGDTLTVGTNGANDRDLMVFTPSVGSPRNFSILKSVMKKLTFAGGAGSDHLTVDFGNGNPMTNFPVASPVVQFTGTGADTLTVTGNGTYRFLTDPATNTPTLTVESFNGATVRFEAPVSHLAGLTLNNGKAEVAAGSSRLLVVGALAVSNNGDLEMNDNDLIATGTSLASIETALAAGYAFGSFASVGISSAAARDNASGSTTLGVLTGQQFNDNNGGTFNGQTVNATDVLVKYTYFGDVDFNGAIDASDYNLVDFGFSNHLTGWANGDADYSGAVDVSDYNLIDVAFVSQTGVL